MLKPTLIGSAARAGTVAHWTSANYESCVKTSARIARLTPRECAFPRANDRHKKRGNTAGSEHRTAVLARIPVVPCVPHDKVDSRRFE
jgi:hypothetical protein